ncbi:hypothetical protein ABPG72_020642 [Tetrahymena utriculariae]
MSSYSFLNLLPEANPIRDKSQKEDQIIFKSTQCIFQLKQDDEFLVLGQQDSREPLHKDYENKLQLSKTQFNANEQQNALSKSSSQSSNIQEKTELEESSESQKAQQEEKECVEKLGKQIKQKQKTKEKKLSEPTAYENSKNQTACQFYQNEESQKSTGVKLIYKKQNQHMLINLQNRIQVIKDTQSKKFMLSSEPSNSRNENLMFDSQFESGNIASVYMLGEQKYNLLVQQDLNTNGYTQWFNFKVTNKTKCQKVMFTIGNFYKKDSLFQKGMKISVFSKKKLEYTGIGWHKSGFNIKYSLSTIQKGISYFSTNQNGKISYLLQFKYDFEYDEDETYFAYSIPYTYSQLQKYLNSILSQNYSFFSIRSLCNTLLGNQLFLITITNPITKQNQNLQKKAIFITCRVHPGETISSYVLEGLINFLLSDSEEAYLLREQFIFKIVPMLNPDGVIHGNYRCSLAGCDLNRRWRFPTKNIHPEIYYTKRAIYELNENYPLILYCDLHGHSRKKDFFLYGCEEKNDFYQVREFPFILSKINPFFDFKSCDFRIYKSKESTSRQTLFRDLNIENIFTIETSFCGPSSLLVHFNIEDLKQIGVSLAKSILCRFSNEKEECLKKNNIKLEDLQELIQNNKNQDDYESDGSDSQPSCDNLDEKDLLQLLPTNDEQQCYKKKRKRTASSYQNRIVITKYFSKSPIREKERKEEKLISQDLKELKKQPSRPLTQISATKQTLLKTQQDILETDTSPKIYNFINTQSRKTPIKSHPIDNCIFSNTNIQQQMNQVNEFTPLSANLPNKQKQIYYQNEKNQFQKNQILYQHKLQQQKEIAEDKLRQNQEEALQKNIEGASRNTNYFQKQTFRKSQTPQQFRSHTSNNTINRNESDKKVIIPEDSMDKINPRFYSKFQKEGQQENLIENNQVQYEFLEKNNQSEINQINDTIQLQQFQTNKINEAQSSLIATVYSSNPKTQTKNSYMHFFNQNTKYDISQADFQQTTQLLNNNNSYKNRTNQFLTGYKLSNLQKYIQQHQQNIVVRKIKTVLSQNSPSPNQRFLNRQITSAQIKSDQKKSNSLRTEPELFLSNNFQNEKLQTEHQDHDLIYENPSLNNYLFQQEYLQNSQNQNKNYKTPDRNHQDSQNQQNLSNCYKIKQNPQNETQYGRMIQTSYLKQKSNDQQQVYDISRKEILNKKLKEQQNVQDEMQNFAFVNSNQNIFSNQVVQNQLNNIQAKTKNNIFYYTTSHFANNNNQLNYQPEKPKFLVKDSERISPFRMTSQDHTINNFQIKSMQANYSNQKQQIMQQKQPNIQSKKLNQTQIVEKDLNTSELVLNQKLQNKYEVVYSRKRSFTNVQSKINQQQQQE